MEKSKTYYVTMQPSEHAQIVQVEGRVEYPTLRKGVGDANIEMLRMDHLGFPGITIWLDEDGLGKQLKPNICIADREVFIVGPIIVTKDKHTSDDTYSVGMSHEEAKKLKDFLDMASDATLFEILKVQARRRNAQRN